MDETQILLSGGNPQIAKADGDESVQANIKAMPGWTSNTEGRFFVKEKGETCAEV